jgi:hypothetical protein
LVWLEKSKNPKCIVLFVLVQIQSFLNGKSYSSSGYQFYRTWSEFLRRIRLDGVTHEHRSNEVTQERQSNVTHEHRSNVVTSDRHSNDIPREQQSNITNEHRSNVVTSDRLSNDIPREQQSNITHQHRSKDVYDERHLNDATHYIHRINADQNGVTHERCSNGVTSEQSNNVTHERCSNSVTPERHLKVYFVVADIKDAFGSVVHSKLTQIFGELKQKLPRKMFLHQVSILRKNK